MTDNSPEPRAEGQPPKVERGGLWGLFLGLAGLLLPPYGVVLSVFGVVQGFRARRAARAHSSQAPGALMSVALGVVGIVMSTSMLAVLFVYQEEVTEFRGCSARAHTVSTQKECESAWESDTGLPPAIVGG
ncbi:hypothetical protein GCM10007079_13960 [Nocardiopsis terrae]|uniref:Membrane protein YeaQ/YmgE (Transglycosylase-associated protein family) n=1 Tax=Nocardiopsis terrae TaxID=372655 RepID=A0ABR9HBY0_9ACTN|nr:DUF4190 domain-containing protein [Nocardiopsis terrae]MBE1456401.1 putative membrane protein YeaQ/YmgE (transglycosylase-associated protein family) [Nocardiopsis terrae]GHC77059.1 hypothetical protein GCM10007079_13960 [Nocardiopsis terrae]